MSKRIASTSDALHLGGRNVTLEKRVWFMGRFTVSTRSRLSVDSLLRHLDSRNDIETVLKLSEKGLSWGTQGSSWWRPWHRPLPFALVELSDLEDVFQETSQPHVLICVERPIQGTHDSSFQVFAFRLHDVNDVRRFHGLFQTLANAGGPPGATKDSGEERFPSTRLAVRPSSPLEAENRTGTGNHGDGIRNVPKRKNQNSAAFDGDPNNNAEEEVKEGNAAGRNAGNHQPIRTGRSSVSEIVPPDNPTNRLKFYSPQPVRRTVRTDDLVSNQMLPPSTTVPIYGVVAPRTEDGRRVPAPNGSKVTSKLLSDDEDVKKAELDLTWTRNTVFSSKAAANYDGVLSNYSVEPPKPMPRTRNIEKEMAGTSTQVQSSVLPDTTVSPTQEKAYILAESAASPTQVKSYSFAEKAFSSTHVKGRVIPERAVSPTHGKTYVVAERTVTPTLAKIPIGSSDAASERTTISPTQTRDRISSEGSSAPVRVYVPDYRSPVVPEESLPNSGNGLHSEHETPIAESSFRNSSFSHSVVSDSAAESREPPKPKPRRSDQATTVSLISTVNPTNETKRTVTPVPVKVMTVAPTLQMKTRTVSPTQMRSSIDGSDDTSERTITPTQMRNQTKQERAITPTSRKGQKQQNVQMFSVDSSSGPVKVYVPDRKIGAAPQRSLLKSRKDLDPDLQETAITESNRQKKSLSFNPSVLVNGTTGNSLSESESTDQPGRTSRLRHASLSTSAVSEGPGNPSAVRNRVMLRGMSLPNGVSTSFVPASDPTDRRSHVWMDGRHGSGANRDHTQLERDRGRELVVSGTFRRVRVVPIGSSIPVDVISEEEGRQFDRRPGTHALRAQSPDQRQGRTTHLAAKSKDHRRMGNFGRRSGEPSLQYASDNEEWARSRSHAQMILGRGAPVVHQTNGGRRHPSVAYEPTAAPNGQVVVRMHRREDERGTAALQERVERGNGMDRGRATPVRRDRRIEAADEIMRVPVTHDRHSDPVGRSSHYRRSQSVIDPRRGPSGTYNPDIAHPNGHQPGQLAIRSRSATRPLLVSRTTSYENGTAQLSVPAGQFSGGHQDNARRKSSRYYESDQSTRVQNGGVSGREKRKSNLF